MASGDIPNLIFYGPSGVGKTTLATYIAKKTNRTLKKLNGTTASTADIKEIVAQLNTFSGLNGILLYLDEIQYFNKKQQQTLLEYIENGSITLIASTTENPYFYVYNAILSRSTVFEFKPVDQDEVEKAVYRASDFLAEESGTDIEMPEECAKKIASGCGGDVRKAMNALFCTSCSTVSSLTTFFPSISSVAITESSTAFIALRTSPPQPDAIFFAHSSGISISVPLSSARKSLAR